ncbi:MAG: TRAP transporter substrate-binding protein, partial [Deferrisomatales bacterium]
MHKTTASPAVPTISTRCQRALKRAGALGAALVVLAGVGGHAAADTLKFGTTVPPTHVWNKVAGRFADNLKTASNGRFEIKVSPLSKLGNEQQMVDMIQIGSLEFSLVPAAMLANREESLMGWSLPYLFADVTEAGKAANLPAAREMLRRLETHGIVGLGYTFAGMRQVLGVKPVKAPGDLVNRKVRSFPSPVYNDWWTLLGAAPTALALGEVGPALTTGLLDAIDADLDIIVGLKYNVQAPNLAMTNHMAFPGVVMISKKWWDALPKADQELITTTYA